MAVFHLKENNPLPGQVFFSHIGFFSQKQIPNRLDIDASGVDEAFTGMDLIEVHFFERIVATFGTLN